MNLKINFEEDKNTDILFYQKTPFRVYENGATLDNWFERKVTITRDFSDIGELINLEDFAYSTSMEDIVKFNQELDSVNEDYGGMLRSYDSKYVFGVSKKYAWKPGIYDAIRHIINYLNESNKRAAKIETLFKRIEYNRYAYDRFKTRMNNLSIQRDKAKAASGSLVDNMEDLMDIQTNVINKINESTLQANSMSDKFNIYNYVTNVPEDSEPSFTNMKLWTIVVAEPNEMTIINNDGGELSKIQTPKLLLAFNRKLYKVLSGQYDFKPQFKAHAIQGIHPYINDPFLWDRASEDRARINHFPWGTLCLSSFQDDITRPLARNDYKSFLMGVMNWNSIYNIADTNPYNNPEKIYWYMGFPEKDINKARRLKSFVGWNNKRCWSFNLNNYIDAELNETQQSINRSMDIANSAVYSKYVVKDCNKKQCPFREECIHFIRAKNFKDSSVDWLEIIESFSGYVNDGIVYNQNTITAAFQRTISKLMQISVIDRWNYLEQNLNASEYWVVDNTIEDKMKRKLTNWHRAINNERRPNYDG
tara:strand:- start:5934 stop:7535 length:1602 start_codon:yes stop_codon:yes gene_type:complete